MFVRQMRIWYYGVDFGTTESILVLLRLSRYDGVDFGTAESMLVLRSRLRYYRAHVGTTESILGTTESSPVLQRRSWYYSIAFGTTTSSLVLTESISVIQSRHRINFGGSWEAIKALWGGFRTPNQAQRGPREGSNPENPGPKNEASQPRGGGGPKMRSPNRPKSVSSRSTSRMWLFCSWE